MPVVAAVEHDEQAPGLDAPKHHRTVLGLLGKAHPQHVHGRAEIVDFETGEVAHCRVAAVGADDEIGAHVERAVGHFGADAGHRPPVLDEVGDLGLHLQPEVWVGLRLVGEKIEEVPLRHEGDEVAARRQVREIGKHHAILADQPYELAQLLMRPLEELFEQAELVHDLEGGGMDGVAAEVA